MRQRSSGSEADPSSTVRPSTDRGADASEHHIQRDLVYTIGETDKSVKRQPSLDVSHDKEPGHQLKRTSSDDQEPDVQAKRPPDVADPRVPVSSASSDAVMAGDEEAAGESGTRRMDVHDSTTPATSLPESTGDRHLEQMPPLAEKPGLCSTGDRQMATVPPRLMEKGTGDEPMVIEFSTALGGGDSGHDDDLSVRAGHKRARINSGTVHNDVIRQSFVKRPVTFYGKFAQSLLCIANPSVL